MQVLGAAPFPSRETTEVTVASLNTKAIISIGKATFLSNFIVKAQRKAPAQMLFSLEES